MATYKMMCLYKADDQAAIYKLERNGEIVIMGDSNEMGLYLREHMERGDTYVETDHTYTFEHMLILWEIDNLFSLGEYLQCNYLKDLLGGKYRKPR